MRSRLRRNTKVERNETLENFLNQAHNAYYALSVVMDDIESNAIDSYHSGDITYEQLKEIRELIDYYMGRLSSNK